MSRDFIHSHRELLVYQTSVSVAMRVFQVLQAFPASERYLLREQMLRASRSVCANLAEAWQKRRYRGAFVAKLNEAEAEAAEMQTWLEFSVLCGYLEAETGQEMVQQYREILGSIARLIEHADAWVLKG
jgi:four helix bundle protein